MILSLPCTAIGRSNMSIGELINSSSRLDMFVDVTIY